jgi:hypothetical protein
MIIKALAVKTAVVAATLTTAGGVALAATTGALPGSLGNERVSPATSASHHPVEPSVAPSDGADKGEAHGSPSPSLVGLCHAYAVGNKADHGKALQNPAFTALIRSAGGADKVESFCAAVLAAKASQSPDRSGPENSHAPSGAPESSTAKVHPSRPADDPSGAPTDRRSGNPSTSTTPGR